MSTANPLDSPSEGSNFCRAGRLPTRTPTMLRGIQGACDSVFGMIFDTPLREYMSSPVTVVTADASLDDVLRTLREYRVSSVAVVGREGQAVGVLSYSDLLQIGRTFTPWTPSLGLLKMPSMCAGDLIRAKVIDASGETTMLEAARLLLEKRVQRLYVLEGGKPVGVFSTRDLMRALALSGVKLPLSEVMGRDVPLLEEGDPATSAINLVQGESGACVVVVDRDQLVGIVTQQEALAARELAKDTTAGEIVGYSVICLDAATPVDRAARFALATRARRVLAVSGMKICGSLSGLDFAAAVVRAAEEGQVAS